MAERAGRLADVTARYQGVRERALAVVKASRELRERLRRRAG
jgi:hypothetical protein